MHPCCGTPVAQSLLQAVGATGTGAGTAMLEIARKVPLERLTRHMPSRRLMRRVLRRP